MAQAIAVQPYVIIERAVVHQMQTAIVHEHELRLFATKITSVHREFAVQNVYDMSFRTISGEEGFLYFHTNQGVCSFMVRTHPGPFIEAYKHLRDFGGTEGVQPR